MADPLSFTASLITVAALVAASSKKIYDLRGKLRNAPKDVENLLEQLQTFENLLKELETQFRDHQSSAPPQETLLQVWGSSIAQMKRDVESLQQILSKVELLLKKRSRSSKILLLARQTLSEKEVEKYQRKIDTHCGTLTNIQTLICGQKLDKISQSVVQLSDEDRAGFRTVSSQISQSAGQLGTEVKNSFSTVSSQLTSTESANGVRHKEVLAHLDDHAKSDNLNAEKMDEVFQQQLRSMDMNEAGLQAVHSSLITASSSGSQEHKTTQAMLSQYQGELQQFIRGHITFGTVEHSKHWPATRPKALDSTTTETAVFWNYRSHRLPIGMLQICLTQTQQSRKSTRSAPQVSTKSTIALEFVPPRWLSNVMIRYSMKLSHALIDSEWRWGATLEPLTVNYNPYFIEAIRNVDVEGVRKSFATGLAKPTDYVLFNWDYGYREGLVPWYMYPNYFDPWHYWLARIGSMFKFMVEDGLPGQEFVMTDLRLSKYTNNIDLLNYIRYYLKHGGKVFATQKSVIEVIFLYRRTARVDWIPEILFNSSEPWLVDDFSSLEICLIGTVARVDSVFRDRLKNEMASYRSPVSLFRAPFIENLFETTFGTASIQSHFSALTEHARYRFLSLLCRSGSSSMLRLFLDMGVDVNGGIEFTDLLGSAAAARNMEVVRMLFEAGANSSLALLSFLSDHNRCSDADFNRLLEMLVEKARPASFTTFGDPLHAILSSSRALVAHPKAPEILLNRNVFTIDMVFGGGDYGLKYRESYMYNAIRVKNPFVVDLLIQKGAHADTQISDKFECRGEWFGSCTWITFSVMYGAASCAEILIQHGADVTALDGAGRSAVQLAKMNVLKSHPRNLDLYGFGSIIAEQDAETLAVVERAFNLRFQGTKSLEDHMKLSDGFALQLPQQEDKPVSALRKTMQRALGIIFTPTQIDVLHKRLRGLYLELKQIWSLSFCEALLVRSFYVLSYALLLALEILAFVKGHKRIPTPSRSLLSAVALLSLALVWGSSQMGFSLGSITARSKSEMDS